MKRAALVIALVLFLCPSALGYSIVLGETYGDGWVYTGFENRFTYWDPSIDMYTSDLWANSCGQQGQIAMVQADEGDPLDVIATLSITWSLINELTVSSENMSGFDFTYIPSTGPTVTDVFTVELDTWVFSDYYEYTWPQINIDSPPTPIDLTIPARSDVHAQFFLYADVELIEVSTNPIPEPATVLLLSVGLIGLVGSRKFSKI